MQGNYIGLKRFLIALPALALLFLGSFAIVNKMLFGSPLLGPMVAVNLIGSVLISWWLATHLIKSTTTMQPTREAAAQPDQGASKWLKEFDGLLVPIIFLVVGLVVKDLAADTQEVLKTLGLVAPASALVIWLLLLFLGLMLARRDGFAVQPGASARDIFIMTFIFGAVCTYLGYRLVIPIMPYTLWMPVMGTVFMTVWMFFVGTFALQGASEDQVRGFLIGTPVGALIAAVPLLFFG